MREPTECVTFVRLNDLGLEQSGGLIWVDASGVLRVSVDDDYYSGCVLDPVACARIGRALLGIHPTRRTVTPEAYACWGGAVLLANLGDEFTRTEHGGPIWGLR